MTFADDVNDPNMTLISEDEGDGFDTVDNTTEQTQKTDSQSRNILWMVVAFPVFLLYWTIIGLPLGTLMIHIANDLTIC